MAVLARLSPQILALAKNQVGATAAIRSESTGPLPVFVCLLGQCGFCWFVCAKVNDMFALLRLDKKVSPSIHEATPLGPDPT